MKNSKEINSEISRCSHRNIKKDSGFYVCQDCGLILDENVVFEGNHYFSDSDSQRDYERKIRIGDSKALQDPVIKEKYERIKTLEKWFRDYESDFTEQKKTIGILKSYGIGLNIDSTKFQEIKDIYLRYNKYHRHTYQNMVIIFLSIVWMEIKDSTNIRIEEFIKVSRELGHKINKKMISNAMLKVKRTEKMLNKKKGATELEKQIKNKIKIVFQKDLNGISYEKVSNSLDDESQFNKVKLEMQLKLDEYLKQISYEDLKNLNYKAFTAGLIYYIGQTLEKERRVFTQNLIEEATKFSSTTIRKKYHFLVSILGDPRR
ncbi:MAG: TFIIB-type zinc ribbon-containing protein [Promethearchaeota archaeon]